MLHIITGPPCAGKTTYIQTHAQPGDIRIDYDHIANTIAGQPEDNHTHGSLAHTTTRAARTAAINHLLNHHDGHNVWIIDTRPTTQRLKQYKAQGAKIHHIDPGKQTVMRRCKTQRPPNVLKAAALYYSHRNQPKSTQSKGLGYAHTQQRKRLLHNHKDGTPCYWCGKPMYRNPEQNWDKKPLAADHINPRKNGGKIATRLLHFTCNSQRQDGTNDHKRPATQPKTETTAPQKPHFTWG